MISGDVIGLISVYLYVIVLLFISEKVLIKHPFFSRKFLHIMVGNVFFLLPLFETRWVMAFLAAAPFIALTFLVSPYSPFKIVSGTSASGHGLGLVYYSLSWTILALIFFDTPVVIAMGIVAMSYGDGFASLIGSTYGTHKYRILGETKTLEGSLCMFIVILIMGLVTLYYYHALLNIPVIISVALFATLIEGITPKGLDNLTVSFLASFIYYGFIIIG
jgi:dolichol kinase